MSCFVDHIVCFNSGATEFPNNGPNSKIFKI